MYQLGLGTYGLGYNFSRASSALHVYVFGGIFVYVAYCVLLSVIILVSLCIYCMTDCVSYIYSTLCSETDNGKSYCCNDAFTDVRFTSLLAKNIRRIQISSMLLESTFFRVIVSSSNVM